VRRCIFFDRDGIVNESPGPEKYVERWEDFHLMPGFIPLLRRVSSMGFVSVVVTNQRCVALGRLTVADLERMHDRFRALLRDQYRLDITDILYCPHDHGVCDCRKPKPGLLLEAARRHGLDLPGSWMVGDAVTDVEAGFAAGCRTILVGAQNSTCLATVTVASLEELDSLIATGRLVV
jgi:D-glycero-D-manno-heptose 1,7-bisphosphate phosphatase